VVAAHQHGFDERGDVICLDVLVEHVGAVRLGNADHRVGEGEPVAADLVDVDLKGATFDFGAQRFQGLEGAGGDARRVDADARRRGGGRPPRSRLRGR
jgi:hypothetical protein